MPISSFAYELLFVCRPWSWGYQLLQAGTYYLKFVGNDAYLTDTLVAQ